MRDESPAHQKNTHNPLRADQLFGRVATAWSKERLFSPVFLERPSLFSLRKHSRRKTHTRGENFPLQNTHSHFPSAAVAAATDKLISCLHLFVFTFPKERGNARNGRRSIFGLITLRRYTLSRAFFTVFPASRLHAKQTGDGPRARVFLSTPLTCAPMVEETLQTNQGMHPPECNLSRSEARNSPPLSDSVLIAFDFTPHLFREFSHFTNVFPGKSLLLLLQARILSKTLPLSLRSKLST